MPRVYFASDVHLGFPNPEQSQWREHLFVNWLDSIKNDAVELYLVGDIFDFWYEYKFVIPKGFVRTLGKLAELADLGVKVHFFTGNHDVWAFSYLHDEIGATLHFEPFTTEIAGKKFHIAHGDGLGPGEWSYKLLLGIFHSRIAQFLFSTFLHPNLAMRFGHSWSNSSRNGKGLVAPPYMGDDKEHIYMYAKELAAKEHFDYMIFGHRHIIVEKEIEPDTHFVMLGDGLTNFSYGVFDGEKFEIRCLEIDKTDKK